ncbi:MAG: SGNH/GDSL hydrolase family protein [Methylobacter sp.]
MKKIAGLFMNGRLTSIVVFLTFLMAGTNVGATSFNSLYAFGDSLSDGGSSPSAVISIYKLLGNNCDPSHPCPPYFEGHYSNGNVAVEYLADSILQGGANSTNFHNFAVSGATTGIGNYGDGGTADNPGAFGLPGMFQEIGLYLTGSGGRAEPNSLYFIWGGANDFLTGDSATFAAVNIAEYVGALAEAGAEHILVPNIPDLSLTPFVKSVPGLEPLAQAYSSGFNIELATQLGSLSTMFPATDIIQFDTFSFFNDLSVNPDKYGFTDSQNACLPSLLVAPCKNPDSYISWDGFHPTTQVDALIATAFAQTVPEPGTIVLLIVSFFAMGVAGNHKRKGAN